ncbi:ArsC family reductase [Rhodomicrobium sp.]|uniref:ArsC family reductase n=1 Tax=Rhodomicrobium sp. TaxID=2720632 RepID=UPI0039E2DEFA
MTITVYGIKNCSTVKKARGWLEERGVAHAFHDYKTAGADEALVRRFVKEHGWETLLNRAGTTFRKLPESEKENIDEEKAVALMLANPSIIKRPVLDLGDRTLVGFKPEVYDAAFAATH